MRHRGWQFVVVAVIVLALAPGRATAQRNLAMGCTQTASSHYGYCVGAAKAINTLVPEVNVAVVETGAAVDNIKRMLKGQLDLGLVTADQAYLAWKGLAHFKETPYPDLRLLWVYTVSAQYFIVREETGVKALPELTGKKFNPGIRGSASEKVSEAVLASLGIRPDYFRGGTSDAVDAMKDKRIVGYAKTGIGFNLDASTMDIAVTTPIRILPFSAEDVARVKAQHPYYPWIEVPAGAVKGMGGFWTPAIVVGFAAPRTFPADLTYKIVKAINEGYEHQKAAFKGVVPRIPDSTLSVGLSPLHAGAVKYYRELGLTVRDALVPAEAR